ncbi:MAG: Na+ dependent nucleoside transporter N-terminal domain-containing protein, partial [Tsuneonella troitsensis]
MPPIVASLLGIVAILAIAFVLSNGKRRISLRIVGSSFALQALLAFIVLRTPWGVAGIQGMS